MITEEKALARILFQKKVLSFKGQAYEDLGSSCDRVGGFHVFTTAAANK